MSCLLCMLKAIASLSHSPPFLLLFLFRSPTLRINLKSKKQSMSCTNLVKGTGMLDAECSTRLCCYIPETQCPLETDNQKWFPMIWPMENKPNNANQETKSVGLLNAPGLQHSCKSFNLWTIIGISKD